MNEKLFYLIVLFVFFPLGNRVVLSQSNKPPFIAVTIHGEVDHQYNRVSLFESGSSKEPLKSDRILSGGEYSIFIRIPGDMKKKGSYYVTDMRFWNDANNNEYRDEGEGRSQCHFIIWYPEYNKVVMQVYEGPTYEIESTRFEYNLK